MLQYAPRSLTTSIPALPGTSRSFRLPMMMPGEFLLSATGYPRPSDVRSASVDAASTAANSSIAATPVASGHVAQADLVIGDGLGIHSGNGENSPIGPILPTGPTGPITVPPTYPVALDLYHGDQLVASGARPALQGVTAPNDDTWRVRVNFSAQSQPTDNVQVNLGPYYSTLPILTRKIPLAFLQQGFDNNWSGRNYISLAFENGTASIRFDPEIASYYHLTESDYPVTQLPTEVPPNMMVKDVVLSMSSSDGGYEDLPGPLTYILVTATVGGVDGQPMNFSLLGGHYTIAEFTIIVKVFITMVPGGVDGASQNVVGYRTQVDSDLLNRIAATNTVGEVIAWIANGKLHSEFYNTALPALQNWLDAKAGIVGAALTPWFLGAAFEVWNVSYNPANSQPVPPSGPQGDIVIEYLGLSELSDTVISRQGSTSAPAAPSITGDAPEGTVGTVYSMALSVSGGVGPYAWSVSGTLPVGVSLVGSALTGTPTAPGAFSFQVKVVDASGAFATKTYAVAINAPGVAVATPSPLPSATVGDAYGEVLLATGLTGRVTWSATGVPPGLTLSSAGVLSGTPTGDGGVATIVVQAAGSSNAVARRVFSLNVLDALLFGEQLYTPRGAGDAIWNPPQTSESVLGHLPTLPLPTAQTVTLGNLSKIDHIVVLMMENRSFDHMLGYLSKEGGRSDVEGLKWENDSNRTQFNFYNGRFYYPNRLLDTHLFNPESLGPDHSFESVKAQMADNMGHFVSDYARNKITNDDPAQLSQVMGYYTGEQLPTYDLLAREFAICDHWFCSHPGPTWPNRFVYLTGDLNRDSWGEPEVNTPLYADFTPSEATTIFDLLTEREVTWQYFEQRASTMRGYTKYTFDMVNVLPYSDPAKGFAASVLAGLKDVTFVDPLFGDLPAGINSPQDNDDAPPSDLADGQRFVLEVATTLFTPTMNPNWLTTMLVVVYDEHGGFYDHVQPPSNAIPLTGQNSGKLGPRVPAFVISPWTPAGLVLKDVFEHTTIAATILNRFCAPHPPYLSPRVSAAPDLRDALSLPEPRGTTTPLFGSAVQKLPQAVPRTDARTFKAPVGADAFGSLLGAIALMLGQGGQ